MARSAGADPGPACYGRGGTRVTVTDANLALGLDPAYFAGGQMTLDVDAAEQALARLGDELGLSTIELAKACATSSTQRWRKRSGR